MEHRMQLVDVTDLSLSFSLASVSGLQKLANKTGATDDFPAFHFIFLLSWTAILFLRKQDVSYMTTVIHFAPFLCLQDAGDICGYFMRRKQLCLILLFVER